jgi:hypothetical protein
VPEGLIASPSVSTGTTAVRGTEVEG